MKKIILLIFVFFISLSFVSAKENKLYISSSDNKLYYDSKLFDTNKFMNYLDMIPGDTFNDELIIENNTKYTFKLYLKIKNRNNNDLMNYLSMKLYLDNNLMYDGDVIGTNLNNLDDVYYVGTFKPNQVSKLDAYVNFSIDYSNMENKDTLVVDWLFYAETDEVIENNTDNNSVIVENNTDNNSVIVENNTDNNSVIVEILPAPTTGINIDSNFIGYGLLGLCLISSIVVVILFGNKDDKHEDK